MIEKDEIREFIVDVCKVGQGAACCKYLLAGTKGLECGKLTEWKKIVDDNWKVTPHVAQGDNCQGINGVLTIENIKDVKSTV